MASYNDNEAWAKDQNYASWAAYATANPNSPTETHIDEMLEEATEIINMNIGSFNSNITDTRFLSWVQKLHLRMTNRMRQIELAGGKAEGFLGWSITDFLQERERNRLQTIGKILGYYRVGKVVT